MAGRVIGRRISGLSDCIRWTVRVETAAADGWRWAALLRGRPQAGGWNGSLVRSGSSGQALLGGRCPTFRAADRGGSGPVDDVGGPGG